MANFKWDHLVHYMNDLDKPVELFKEYGLRASKGGAHKAWGTYNALSYFGLTYIEFLGIENLELAKATEHNVVVRDAVKALPDHEALSRVVLRTDDIEGAAALLKTAGLTLSPIIDGRRLDQEGRLIEWRMLTIDGDFQGLVYPFIIQWSGNDEKRLARLSASGVIRPHSSGQAAIAKAVFRVTDPIAVAAHWGALFQLPVIRADAEQAALKIGDQSFDFVQGDENQFKQVIIETDSAVLQGKTLRIGEGEYVFV
ncbi:VOC family protein [Paenibacillus sanguinis]|uniref:VOC family protein n=1 Tax=Paenibacillus sanguinis TaxID=225906 RepID=UPI0003618255|nr:VOC family protein [Paenibacillus sanguinis]